MKTNKLVGWGAAVLSVSLLSVGCGVKKSAPVLPTLATAVDSMSYAMGVANGFGFAQNLGQMPGEPVNKALLLAGFSAAFSEEPTLMTKEASQDYLNTYFQQLQERLVSESKTKNEAFLVENAKRPEVKTTASGLQYEILQLGSGPRPTVEDTVRVHYTGTLIDGKKFDSSLDRGEPTKFGLLQVIPGWTEGLCLIPQGSKAKLYIPAKLAYGERGMGQMIPPHSTLVFDIELLEVIKGQPIPIANAAPVKKETAAPTKEANAKPAKKAKAASSKKKK